MCCRDYLREEERPGDVITPEHLQREWKIVCMAKDEILAQTGAVLPAREAVTAVR
jgi:hypothetical protein